MGGIEFAILVTTITITILLGLQRNVATWWRCALSNKKAAFLIFLTFLVPSLGSEAGADISNILQDKVRIARMVIIIMMFMFAMKGLISRRGTWRYAGAPSHIMVLFCLLAISSALYSVNPALTVWKGFELLTLVLTTMLAAGQLQNIKDIQWPINLLSLVLLFYVVSVMVGLALAPSIAFGFQTGGLRGSMAFSTNGVFPPLNANSVTEFAMLFACLTLAMALNMDRKYRSWTIWLLVFLGLVTGLMGHGRTSIFAGGLAIIGILIFGHHKILAAILGVFGTIGVLLSSFGDIVTGYIYRGQSQQVFESLSGRTVFWDKVWETFLIKPWLGFGYYAGHRETFRTSSVDNTYLEVLVDLGIVGFIIFSLPVLLTAASLFRTMPRKNNILLPETLAWLQLMSLFLLLFIRSLTGPSFQVLSGNVPLYVVLLIATSALVRIRHVSTKTHLDSNKEFDRDKTVGLTTRRIKRHKHKLLGTSKYK